MPQAIPLIAGYITTGVLAAQGAYLLASQIIGGLVAFGLSRLDPFSPEQPGVDDPGIRANARGTVEPIPIVYGRRQVGGVLAQICTTGHVTTEIVIPPIAPGGGVYDIPDRTDNKYLNLIICWAEGEIEGVQLLYFNDDLSTSEDFEDWFTVEHYNGTDDQVASPGFLSALARTFDPDSAALIWTTEHRLRGIAYTYVKLEYDAATWVTGIPAITAQIKGRKVLDVRTGVTAWSDNPALCIYDYLTNARFGRGIDPSEIDTDSFIEAANYCDQEIYIETQVAVPPDIPSAGVTQARYACDAILNPDDTCLDNLKILLSTCRGALVFSGGLYKLKLDKPEVVTFALTEDNIVGAWNILLESSGTRFNRIHATWRNKATRYQEDIAILESPTFLAADNDEILEAKIDLPATTNPYRPLQLAGIALRQSRYSLQVEVTCTIEALYLEVFDVVAIYHELPGWQGQYFRVMGISLESDDQVRLQLQQYDSSVYDLDSQNDEDSPPPTHLPDPRTVPGVEIYDVYLFENIASDGSVRNYIQPVWRSEYDHPNLYGFRLRWRPYNTEDPHPWNFLELPVDAAPSEGIGQRYQTVDIDIYRGQYYQLQIVCVNKLGIEGTPYENTSILIGSVPPLFPTKPTSARAAGYTSGVLLTWTNGDRATTTEIWRTTGGTDDWDSGEAVLIGTTEAESFIDVIAWDTQCNYWIRSWNATGYSDFQPDTDSLSLTAESGLNTYADDAAAGAAGLITGDLYMTAGAVKVKT